MKQTLQLGLRQQLAMTPQLQQAIRLLQLSTMELQNEVQDALESNFMLERAEEGEETAPPPPPANGSEPAAAAPEPDIQPVDIPKELVVDSAWEDIYESPTPYQGSSEPSGDFEVQRAQSETLRDNLIWQLELIELTPADRLIAEVLVDAIDDDGYLGCTTEEALAVVRATASADPAVAELEVADVEAVLHQIQNFEPTGVGARDIAECLLLQLRQYPTDHPQLGPATRLIRDHLPLLEARDFSRLERQLNVTEAGLREVIDFIRTLNPKPGGQLSGESPEYVIPDVIVVKKNGAWHVELNPEAMPRVRINALYAGYVRRGDDSADNESLRKHLNEARWFIKSLRSRSETLLKVATCIVERQQAFLEHGEEAMKPMVLHDVAEAVGMHESTISRVTTRKYMHTPRGLLELKYFFSSQVATQAGGGASSTAIKALIKKLIAEESPRKPLSDSKIAALLEDLGVNVARRTVAKYRESMLVPSSSERKRLA